MTVVYKTSTVVIDIRILRYVYLVAALVVPVGEVWTHRLMRDHHLVTITLCTQVVGAACKKSASIVVIHAHLRLTAPSPSIGDVLENIGWLVIEIEKTLSWVIVKVTPSYQMHGNLVVYLIIVDLI